VIKVAVLHLGCTEDIFSHVISPSPPCKCGRLFSGEAHRCRRRILPGMAAFGTIESGPHDDEEGLLRVPRSPRPGDAPCVSNVEDSLPAPELRLHIAFEVIGRLRLAQKVRSLSSEELSLVAFLLDQIFLLKEIVQQQGGVVPSIMAELLGQNQTALPLGLATSEISETSKAGSGSSGDGADSGASLSLAVAVEIQSTSGLLVPPLVAKESLAAVDERILLRSRSSPWSFSWLSPLRCSAVLAWPRGVNCCPRKSLTLLIF
jgi:hypothetical protein